MNPEDRVRWTDTLSEHMGLSPDAKEQMAAFREKRQPV
jgi:hypothetical protein